MRITDRRRALIAASNSAPIPTPTPKPYLTFSSSNPFTVTLAEMGMLSGGLYYSTDKINWDVWDGSQINSATSGNMSYLYLRGKYNTGMTQKPFVFNAVDLYCDGNIENLLDWETVANGNHPVMDPYCYSNLFKNCTSLITAPELPAETLSGHCYDGMFYGCTSLTTAPELPATTLSEACYTTMFSGCTSLITAPALPATTLEMYCYSAMFKGCTSLITAPALPATILTTQCYYNMFGGCTSLTTAPKLPATILAQNCYYNMFSGCTSLITAPALPATTLTNQCYYYMFAGCTSLTTVPALPATTLTRNCYRNMFSGCTQIKLSTTQTSEYQTQYRIPTSGTGTTGPGALTNMFSSTGGTFTGTPTINTTYYTSNTVIPAN